jgi:hypothetical protein
MRGSRETMCSAGCELDVFVTMYVAMLQARTGGGVREVRGCVEYVPSDKFRKDTSKGRGVRR